MHEDKRPISILLCALGGEGGGVLSEWLVDAARQAGHPVQGTSIPGVAQRTGATTYYVEIFPLPHSALAGRRPVFSLYPVPGALDLLVSSELLETVRQIGSGMASAQRTQVISSTSRALTTNERMQLGDGRVDAEALAEVVRRFSREHQLFDMAALTRETGTVVSAVMFGAIAASGLLPFPRGACEAVIRAGGRGSEASLAGFSRAFEIVSGARERGAFVGRLMAEAGAGADGGLPVGFESATGAMGVPAASVGAGATRGPDSSRVVGAADAAPGAGAASAQKRPSLAVVAGAAPALPAAVAARFPVPVQELLTLGHARLIDYQDAAYAAQYVERLARVLAAERAGDPEGAGGWATTREMARYLALWMAFDDIVRVADLKCRASRAERVRREVKLRGGELLKVYDHFKPGMPEIAALLPAALAQRLTRWDRSRQARGKAPFALPLKIGSHSISGFLALRGLAGLRWLRRRGERFGQEQVLIERWLVAVEEGARADRTLGLEIAHCGRLIKGYGSTNERGKDNLLHVVDHLARSATFATPQARAEAIRAARIAALADEAGTALDRTLQQHGAPARPVRAVPIRFVRPAKAAATARGGTAD